MARWTGPLAIATVTFAAVGCQWFLVFDERLVPVEREAGDGSIDADRDAGDAGDGSVVAPRCPAKMVFVAATQDTHAFCIDAYEVSQSEYYAFLNDVSAGPAPNLPARCAAKTTHFPPVATCAQVAVAANTQAERDTLPMGCLDWCDAYAFCAWRGARLCGNVTDGAAVPFDGGAERVDLASEWYQACSNHGERLYSYGPALSGVCATLRRRDDPGPCEGGMPGIFHMSGNVGEWDNACLDDAQCLLRGGDHGSPASEQDCRFTTFENGPQVAPALTAYSWNGARCCADP